MIVYRPCDAEGYQWAFPVDGADYRLVRELGHRRRGDRWTRFRVELAEPDDGLGAEPADMPWFGGDALVVNRRARAVLEGPLGGDAEVLPLECDQAELWLIHPVRVVDALDEDRSDLKRFQGSNRVMEVRRYAFREDAVQGVPCFGIPQQKVKMFVTGSVADAARAAHLTGTEFRAVWRS